MYAEILSKALAEAGNSAASREGLLSAAIECRAQMVASRHSRQTSTEGRIACEIAYDRALLALCGDLGMDIAPDRFTHPSAERTRLEQELANAGIRLTGDG